VWAVGPGVGAIEGYLDSPATATADETVTNTIMGAVHAADTTLVGAAAATGTVAVLAIPAITSALPSGGLSVYTTGVAAGTAAVLASTAESYNPYRPQLIRLEDTYVRPIASFVAPAIVEVGSALSYLKGTQPADDGSAGLVSNALPILLDLTGKGINIQQLAQSNSFFDMTGSGYKNLTAWAGAGNGVLFVDTSGQGKLTQANQMVFTDWDPSASTDMQALLDVFDTSHNGTLDSSDADYKYFYVQVTNADGTTSVYSLSSLGITLNLNANAKQVNYADGSSINGETTFTMTAPAAGMTAVSGGNTAASVSLANNSQQFVVTTTTTVNADLSTTIANVAAGADGAVAYQRLLNTSAITVGSTTTTTRILTDLNQAGVVEKLETDVISAVTGGATTETVTNYFGGMIQANGVEAANDNQMKPALAA